MNRTELIKEIALETGAGEKVAKKFLDAAISVIENQVKKGVKVNITGFGSFESRVVKAHTSRNPKTGEPVEVPEKKKVVFKTGESFKKSLNGNS